MHIDATSYIHIPLHGWNSSEHWNTSNPLFFIWQVAKYRQPLILDERIGKDRFMNAWPQISYYFGCGTFVLVFRKDCNSGFFCGYWVLCATIHLCFLIAELCTFSVMDDADNCVRLDGLNVDSIQRIELVACSSELTLHVISSWWGKYHRMYSLNKAAKQR